MRNSDPLVSILINNYNKDRFCEKAVKSALNQEYKKIEVVFYDDGSSDTSVKRIKKIKKNQKKLKIIENKKRGKVFSTNQLNGIRNSLKACRGKFVCILDSDDFFKKNKVKKVVDFFNQNKFCEFVFDLPIISYNSSNEKKLQNQYFYRSYKWPKFPPTSCLSFKKDSLKKNLNYIYQKDLNELWFDFRISTFYALKRKQFNLINENLTFYRQNPENYEKKYKKFLNREWWKRRYQAFIFLKKLSKEKYNKNILTFDYLITFSINKIFLIN